MLLEGRRAIVTAGAGAIGAAIAEAYAREGAAVLVADIDQGRTDETVARVSDAGGRAVGYVGDLTDGDAITEMVAKADAELGGVDILLNGVGEHLGSASTFEDSDEQMWVALHDVNLLHIFRASHAVVPQMKERGWGRIVNISSVEGLRSAPALAVYTAYKAAINAFTKSLAVDLARYGIRVNALAVDKIRSYQVGFYELPAEYERAIPAWIPAGRYGEPVDVAGPAVFLASEMASWVVGHTLVVDGGTIAQSGWHHTGTRWTNQPLLVQYFDEDPSVNDRRPPMVQ